MGSSFNKSDYVKSNMLNDVDLHATRYFEGTLIYGGLKKTMSDIIQLVFTLYYCIHFSSRIN